MMIKGKMTIQDKIKEVLKNKNSISRKELVSALNITERQVIDAIGRLKPKVRTEGMILISKDDIYRLKTQSLILTTINSETNKKKVIAVLKDVGEEGISTEDLAKRSNTTIKVIYDTVSKLRNEKYDIKNNQGFYSLAGQTSKKAINSKHSRNNAINKAIRSKNNAVSSTDRRNSKDVDVKAPRETGVFKSPIEYYLDKISIIPEKDRTDYVDLIKKGAFYIRCAEAMLDVNQKIQEIENGDEK